MFCCSLQDYYPKDPTCDLVHYTFKSIVFYGSKSKVERPPSTLQNPLTILIYTSPEHNVMLVVLIDILSYISKVHAEACPIGVVCCITSLTPHLQTLLPSNYKLSDTEKSNICYLSFPDSNSGESW